MRLRSFAPFLVLAACGTPSEADAGPFVLDDGGVVKVGSVVLQQASTNGATISAAFTTNAHRVGCSRRVDGPCTVVLCGDGAGAITTFHAAGLLTVTAPVLDGGVVLTPNTDQAYSLMVPALWTAPGQALSIAVGGSAEVPAFTVTLASPSTITVTSPTCTVGAPCTVSRSTPFSVSWSGGTTGSVVVDLFSQQGTSPTSELSCRFPASAGSATIPAATMRQLLNGTGSIRVWATSTTTTTVGDFAVTCSATGHTFLASGLF